MPQLSSSEASTCPCVRPLCESSGTRLAWRRGSTSPVSVVISSSGRETLDTGELYSGVGVARMKVSRSLITRFGDPRSRLANGVFLASSLHNYGVLIPSSSLSSESPSLISMGSEPWLVSDVGELGASSSTKPFATFPSRAPVSG